MLSAQSYVGHAYITAKKDRESSFDSSIDLLFGITREIND